MTSCSKQEMMMMATSAPAAPSADEPCSNKRARISLDNDEKEQQEEIRRRRHQICPYFPRDRRSVQHGQRAIGWPGT